MIVDVVNEESNDYDAVESVQDILIAVLPKIEEEQVKDSNYSLDFLKYSAVLFLEIL